MHETSVVAAAGSLRAGLEPGVELAHRWTAEGVTVQAGFTGAELLHLVVAGCVLNDVYREGQRLGLSVAGVRVTASGGFEEDTWRSTGIAYAVEVDTDAGASEVEALLQVVDTVAEVPQALRAGARVVRVEAGRDTTAP